MAVGARDDTAAGPATLEGLGVLVVEDRGLIASKIAQILRRAGCSVAGPAATLKAGLDLAAREEGAALGAAVLDIDLRGEPVYPLAEALRARGVPFLFLTGYGSVVIPEPWRKVARVEKPFDAPTLLDALRRLVAGEPARPGGGAEERFAGQASDLVRNAWVAIKRQRDLIMETQIRCGASSSGVRRPGEG